MNPESTQPLFRHIASPPGLFERIIIRIRREKILRLNRRKLFVWLGLMIIATASVISAGAFFHAQASASGLEQYIAIVCVSPSAALAHWSDVLSSLVESVPVVSVVILGAVIVFLLCAVDEVVRFSKRLRQLSTI